MSDLKPCPFCGREVQLCNIDDNGLGGFSYYYEVVCRHCGLSNKSFYANRDRVENAAIKHWNTRPIEDALQARIEELENTAIVWHKYPEEKPIDGRHLFWDSDGNAPHVLPHNDIVVRDNPGVFSTQTHWAYLPAPPKE